jgi:hypothetical protein
LNMNSHAIGCQDERKKRTSINESSDFTNMLLCTVEWQFWNFAWQQPNCFCC